MQLEQDNNRLYGLLAQGQDSMERKDILINLLSTFEEKAAAESRRREMWFFFACAAVATVIVLKLAFS